MKQMVVLAAMVLLGIAIGTIVLNFSEQADSMGDYVGSRIENLVDEFDSASGS
ncbi:MAG TPA: hypothetical protein GX688_04720 [Clostridiales bacterium]|jgi:hypothetical protein|nr:hypothetical protein [Clostridiales bacterium]